MTEISRIVEYEMQSISALLREFPVSLARGMQSGMAWGVAFLGCLTSWLLFPTLAQHVPALIGFYDLPKDFQPLAWQTNTSILVLEHHARRWLTGGIAAEPWFTIVFPAIISITAVGAARWKGAVFSFVGGVLCLISWLETKLYLQLAVVPALDKYGMTGTIAFLSITAAIIMVYLLCIATSRRGLGSVGASTALVLCLGMGAIMRFLSSSPQLHITLLVAGVVTVFAVLCGVSIARLQPDLTRVFHKASEHSTDRSYDAFISYRREGAADSARLIRKGLLERKIRAFLDVEDLGSAHFDARLLVEIERAPNFLVILSAGCLDECGKAGDWLRQEIAHAIRHKRNIVPILKEDFGFIGKANLPFDIADLPYYSGIKYSHEYFESMMDKLVTFLSLVPRKD